MTTNPNVAGHSMYDPVVDGPAQNDKAGKGKVVTMPAVFPWIPVDGPLPKARKHTDAYDRSIHNSHGTKGMILIVFRTVNSRRGLMATGVTVGRYGCQVSSSGLSGYASGWEFLENPSAPGLRSHLLGERELQESDAGWFSEASVTKVNVTHWAPIPGPPKPSNSGGWLSLGPGCGLPDKDRTVLVRGLVRGFVPAGTPGTYKDYGVHPVATIGRCWTVAGPNGSVARWGILTESWSQPTYCEVIHWMPLPAPPEA